MEDVIKIIGIALVSIIIIAVLKQYKPEYSVLISLIASVLIVFLIIDKFSGIIDLLNDFSTVSSLNLIKGCDLKFQLVS